LVTSLANVRHNVLDLHKTLIDAVRREYERDRGRQRDADFLNALVGEPDFAWLKPLTAMVVRVEEALEREDRNRIPADIAARLRTLISSESTDPAFQRGYAAVLERNPDVLVAHVRAMRALQA
jgi:hypothetical protein